MFTRADRSAVGQYSSISALTLDSAGQPTTHELSLSPFHCTTSGADPSGACAALAAASAPAGRGDKDGTLLAAWAAAAQVGPMQQPGSLAAVWAAWRRVWISTQGV